MPLLPLLHGRTTPAQAASAIDARPAVARTALPGIPARVDAELLELTTTTTRPVVTPTTSRAQARAAAKAAADARAARERAARAKAAAAARSRQKADAASLAPATPANPQHQEVGGASWYATGRHQCAHKSIPKGTVVSVQNVANGRTVTCRIADRGPFVAGRIIDLDRETFAALAATRSGVIDVRIQW